MHTFQLSRLVCLALLLWTALLWTAAARLYAQDDPATPPASTETAEPATERATEPLAEPTAEPAADPAAAPPAEPEPAAAPVPAEPRNDVRLRFNFRFQRWSDVLEWFAEQAGWSLVLDAPPPGTFNYSDTREYTLAESLDLLNGVLLTKGYTLVRRERMLVLVDLSQGIPETLVPRVALEELDQRGRFELVSVMFNVGKRSAEEVVTEIAPLLSPRGKSQPLPKTGQVLVTDTAGTMRAIDAVIRSMPEPRDAPDRERPEKPELAVYPLESADPVAAVQVLEALMPDAKFVRDPGANQISAYATPTQQAAVASVIRQMQTTTGPPESRARFEVYTLDEIDPAGALAALQPLVPAARLSVDPASRKLAAWGTPADQEILRKAVGQLVPGTSGTDDRQIEVYRLSKAEPASVASLLASVVPRARVAVDRPTKSLVVLASLEDQKSVRATIDQIESQRPASGLPEVRLYPAGQTPPATLAAVLGPLVPQATITVEAAHNRLAVTATADDHAIVKQAIDQYLAAGGGQEPRKLELYSVSPAERKRFEALLTELRADFPNLKVVVDAEPGELAIWGTPAEHEVLAGIINEIKQSPAADEVFRLVAYPIRAADPASVLSVLENLFPGTKLVLDAKTRRLVAWTRPDEQAAIKSLIEQMDSDEGGDLHSQLMTYPVDGFDPTTAIRTLRSLVPDATLTHDATAQTLVAFAHKSDQARIAAALEQLQPGDDLRTRPHVVSYPVGSADPSTIYPIISALVPTARVVPNPANGTLAVWATPADHVSVKNAIEELSTDGADASAPKVVVYTLREANAVGVISAVQTAVPLARVGVGQNPRKLVVWARPADHATIRATLDELDQEDLGADGNALKAYQIRTAEPTTLLSNLQTLFATRPTVRLSLDLKNRKIVAMASPSEHATIQRVIEEIESGSPLDDDATFEVHSLEGTDASIVMQVLTNLLSRDSQAVLSTDARGEQLVAVATPEQQQMIRETIARLQTAARDLEVFQLEFVEPRAAEMAIQRLFAAGARGRGRNREAPVVEADTNMARLYVRAGRDDLEEIRNLLVKMGETRLARSDGGSPNVRTIPFSGDSRAALVEIQRVWPRLSKNPLRVLPGRSDLRDIMQSPLEPAAPVAEPQSPEPPNPPAPEAAPSESAPETKTATQEIEPAADEPAARESQEKAEEVSEAGEPAPIIVAPGDDKLTIMSDDPEALEQFERLVRSLSPETGVGGRSISVYPLLRADSVTVSQLLQRMFRRGGLDFSAFPPTIEADERLNAIVIYASRSDRTMVEQLLEVLDTDQVPDTLAANRPVRFPVRNTSAAGIEGVLRDLYQTQLTSGARSKPLPIPSGASRDVAAVIQQINIAAAGPLMTLGVDEFTNSIVVMAPGPLADEVGQLVSELDEAALHENSRSVKVVKLRNVEPDQVKEVLDRLIRDATQRSPLGGRRGRR